MRRRSKRIASAIYPPPISCLTLIVVLERKLNPTGDQINQLPTGPIIAQAISGISTTTDDDSTPNESNEDSKMFEVPSDDSITAQ